MDSVLSTFGVDWRLLIVNAVNFGALMLGLWYFMYEPLTRMLEERRQKVAQGVEDARLAGQKLAEIEESRHAVLAEAGSEADRIVAEARVAAMAKEREIVGHGESVASTLVADAEAQAGELKARAIEESKKEVAKLIVLGVEKSMQAVPRK